jgi:site-specific DNA-methyltransferase (adenine-specific)
VAQRNLRWNPECFDPRPFLNQPVEPSYNSEWGALFSGDCLELLPQVRDSVVDTIFADPPFNLGKEYRARTNDRRPNDEYLEWCRAWIRECARTLKEGGSFFLYNLPKWNIPLGAFMGELGLEFRHWIAVEINSILPIQGRLYPSHYSLLYYSKGKPRVFRKIRTPIQRCRHCGGEIKDYGGHRDAMNPKGVNLKDVWTDIPPVRHWKFKDKARKANALSTKLLDRVVELSTREGDLVLDPFGGSGTTFAVCERKRRHWLGMEIDYAKEIADRLESDDVCNHKNDDSVEDS